MIQFSFWDTVIEQRPLLKGGWWLWSHSNHNIWPDVPCTFRSWRALGTATQLLERMSAMQRKMEEEYSESRREWATYEIAVLWLLIITKAIWRTFTSTDAMLWGWGSGRTSEKTTSEMGRKLRNNHHHHLHNNNNTVLFLFTFFYLSPVVFANMSRNWEITILPIVGCSFLLSEGDTL